MAKIKKTILEYPAVFDPIEKNGGYNVSFPDFPGCVTFGRNFEEAKKKAKEVLELWKESLRGYKNASEIKKAYINALEKFPPSKR